jgi:methyl-accepting chemotaxis protein
MSIQRITRGLSKMVKQLDDYAKQQDKRMEDNLAQIDRLNADTQDAAKEMHQANTIASNLKKILGV